VNHKAGNPNEDATALLQYLYEKKKEKKKHAQ